MQSLLQVEIDWNSVTESVGIFVLKKQNLLSFFLLSNPKEQIRISNKTTHPASENN